MIFVSVAAIIAVNFLACNAPQTRHETPEQPALAGSMQSLRATLTELFPTVVDSEKFADPKNRKEISERLNVLNDIAGKVYHNPVKQVMDPSFAFLSEGFQSEISRAREAFTVGNTEYARYSLLNITSYCIECHTRTSSGPSFSGLVNEKTLVQLKPFEQGEYLMATRQFDAALAQFTSLLRAQNDLYQYIQLDRALRHALAITVKYQNDPDKTGKIVEQLSHDPKVPFFLKSATPTWEKSIREWRADLAKKKAKDIGTQLAFAEKLVNQGKREQHLDSERSGDIDLLRALASLHQIFLQPLNKDQLGRALYLTGTAYEAIRESVTWSLQDNYFESCIRRVPHSTWARKCYRAYQESMIFGFTGSSGTRIPISVQTRMTELETLAQPQ